MREKKPEKYARTMTLKVSEEEAQQIKLLAVREKKTVKALLFAALDKAFPNWREEK